MKKFVHLMKITTSSRAGWSGSSSSSSWLLMVVLLAATAPSIVSSGKCIEQQKEEEALDAHLKVFSTLLLLHQTIIQRKTATVLYLTQALYLNTYKRFQMYSI